jgi:hypothetical protein
VGNGQSKAIIPHGNAADLKGYKMRYEFRGRTLQQAVRNSLHENTGVALRRKDDAGERNSCRQLARWLDQLESEAGDLENEIRDVERHLDGLRQSRMDNALAGAIGAASAAAGPLASALRGARIVRRLLSGGGTNLADVVSAVPVIGGAILAARSALAVARDTREIREAMNALDRLERIANAMEGTARELNNEWRQNRCDIHFS